MTPAKTGRVSSATTATTLAHTFTSSFAASAGDTLVACVYSSGNSTDFALAAPTDNIGGSWTLLLLHSQNSNLQIGVWVKKAAGGETTITANRASDGVTTTRFDLHALCYALADGIDIDTIVASPAVTLADGKASVGSVTSLLSDAIDPSGAQDWHFLIFQALNAGMGTPSVDNSFVIESAVPSSGRTTVAARTITNPGSTSATVSWATGSNTAGNIILALPTAAIAGGQPPRSMHQFRQRRAA